MRNLESGITAAPIDKTLSRNDSALLREEDFTYREWKAYFLSIGSGDNWARRMALDALNSFALR